MSAWFGEGMRGTPHSQWHPEIPVPSGEDCSYCGTVISDWDSGIMTPVLLGPGNLKFAYQHQECQLYAVLGSRWCRAEGVELRTPQHARYHELRRSAYGMMRPLAIERRVLVEFGQYVDDEEIRQQWGLHASSPLDLNDIFEGTEPHPN